MDIRTIRRENLRLIVDGFKSKAEFARRYDVDPTYVSQILNGHRKLGEKAARNLEEAIRLDPLALDSVPTELAALIAKERKAENQRNYQEENSLPKDVSDLINIIKKTSKDGSLSPEHAKVLKSSVKLMTEKKK